MDPNWREQENRNLKGCLVILGIALVLIAFMFWAATGFIGL
jgi:hypothetical protein